MVRAPQPASAASDATRMAMEAVQAGDLRLAMEYFAKSVNADKRNAANRYNFALCAEQVGEIEAAVREYSNALHLNRNHKEAPRRLSSLLRIFELNNWGVLDQMGLLAAFRAPQVDTQPLASAAIQWLKSQTQLGGKNYYGGDDAKNQIGWFGPSADNGYWNPRYNAEQE